VTQKIRMPGFPGDNSRKRVREGNLHIFPEESVAGGKGMFSWVSFVFGGTKDSYKREVRQEGWALGATCNTKPQEQSALLEGTVFDQ